VTGPNASRTAATNDHFECADLIKQRIVGQKREPMLKAEGRDPDVVSETFAFLERMRNGTCFGQIVPNTDVERDGVEIRCDYLATSGQCIYSCSILLGLPRTGDAEAKLREDEKRHE
jgi:hypothetical protein